MQVGKRLPWAGGAPSKLTLAALPVQLAVGNELVMSRPGVPEMSMVCAVAALKRPAAKAALAQARSAMVGQGVLGKKREMAPEGGRRKVGQGVPGKKREMAPQGGRRKRNIIQVMS